MSNYTKSTNFATKDNLSPGNPLKIVKGTEIDTEFNNIQTAVATKTDNASANITGGTIVGITDLAVADGGTGASTATAALNNLLPTQTGNANKYLQTDGTNATWDAVSLSTSDITGTLPVANGGTGVTASTGTGSVVLSNSPTLVTPALGTPASGTATNLTGLPISTGVSGLGSGVATFLGTPSSANLASAVTDETGSGALVFANSPTLVTPALGTPSALVGTNITGTASGLTAGNVTTNANLTGAITSTGNATSLGSFSSANLLGALTDETGTGSAVFATSPTLVTPILGTPTSATLTNATGLPLTTGVTGQLPVANGGTGTATPSIVAGTNVTVSGTWPNQTINSTASGTGDVVGPASSTDNAFARFDSTTGKLLQNSTGATLSDTGAAVFTGALDVLGNSTAGSNIKLYEDTDNGTNYVAFKAPDTIAADVTWTLPAADGTSAQVLSTNGSGTLSWATAGSSQWTTSGSQVYFTGSIGVGTSAINSWFSDNKAIDMPAGSVFSYLTTNQYIGQNTFVNASGTQVAKNTGASSVYAQTAGLHQFASAPSVSANSTQTFTTLLEFGKGKTLALESATSVSGTGISFPSTQSASSDANTLDDYEEGSFTFTGTGFTTSPTKTAYYTKIGDQVTVQIPDITGTSNTTAMTITGLPVALRSARAYIFIGLVYNASVAYTGNFYGAHDNAVTVYWNAVSDAFTASGVKGIPNNVSITYTIN